MEVPAIRYVVLKFHDSHYFPVGDVVVSQTFLFSIVVGTEDLLNPDSRVKPDHSEVTFRCRGDVIHDKLNYVTTKTASQQ